MSGPTSGGADADLRAAALRLAAGRARAAETMPYLATALFAMTPLPRPGIATMAVDRRWRLYWDPAFALSLTVTGCAAVWLHEVGHLLREHADRWTALAEPAGQAPRWNRAADAGINADLRAGGVELPVAGAWYPERVPGGAEGMTAEQLYRLLPAHPDEGPDCGSGAAGPERVWEEGEGAGDGSVDAGRAVLLREQVARAVREQAARGTVPAGWRRWADRTLDPQVDWREELRSVVRRTAATVAGLRDSSYSRPSRRSSAVPGVVLPAMRQPRPPAVRVVVDTSGSMDEVMLARCLAEIGAICDRVARSRGSVEVIACDASAAQVQAVRSAAAVTLVGGGGTDLRVGLEAAAQRRPPADLVVVLTDGQTPWPDAPPERSPRARYVAVLVAGAAGAHAVPSWMHAIVLDPAALTAR